MTVTLAHLSDTHFGGLPHAIDRTAAVLRHLGAMRPLPDAILVTGDIADHGTAPEYAAARATFSASPQGVPLLLCPGNHDRRDAYRAVLLQEGAPDGDDDGPINRAHRVGDLLVLMCDSLVPAPPGERIDHGVLGPQTLDWIDAQLAAREPHERAVIALHHPPVPIGIGLMDPIRLRDAADLATVLGRHERVLAVLTGHAHAATATTFAGLPVLVPGGVASTVTWDAERELLPPITDALPPMFAVHVLADAGEEPAVVTHWRALAHGTGQ